MAAKHNVQTPRQVRAGIRRRNVLVACASFKGTLTSLQAGRALARGLRRAGCSSDVVALADGGEGIVEALARSVPGARLRSVSCRGPLGEMRRSQIALLPSLTDRRGPTAVVEMAASSGLPLVPENRRDPKVTTTLGVGDQIRAALDAGARTILLGLGGSATNDGGAGMAQALGVRLLDREGRDLPPGGAALARLERIDARGIDPRLRRVTTIVACDVRNPLCGRNGASAVYGPQKGATPSDVRLMDRALSRYARVLRRDLGRDVRRIPGSGAAGGMGAGCVAFLNAELKPGSELVLDAAGFDARLRCADLVITGEGRLDRTSLMGKLPGAVADRAAKAGVRCVAIGGCLDLRALRALTGRVGGLESLSQFAGSNKAACARAALWLERLAYAKAFGWLALR
jgi:glycerate 2-kinase